MLSLWHVEAHVDTPLRNSDRPRKVQLQRRVIWRGLCQIKKLCNTYKTSFLCLYGVRDLLVLFADNYNTGIYSFGWRICERSGCLCNFHRSSSFLHSFVYCRCVCGLAAFSSEDRNHGAIDRGGDLFSVLDNGRATRGGQKRVIWMQYNGFVDWDGISDGRDGLCFLMRRKGKIWQGWYE